MRLTALHIARLRAELKDSLPGAVIQHLQKSEADKTVIIQFRRDHERFSLIFKFGSKDSCLYYIDHHHVKIKTTNFLPQLRDCTIKSIDQIGFDRILDVGITGQHKDYRLVFELFGQNSNLLFLDQDNRIITALRKSAVIGDVYSIAESSGMERLLEFDVDKMSDLVDADNDLTVSEQIQSVFTGLTAELIVVIFKGMDIESDTAISEIDRDKLAVILKEILSYCRRFVDPASNLSYDPESGNITLGSDDGSDTMMSISDIFRQSLTEEKSRTPSKTLRTTPLARVKRALKRDKRRLAKLELQIRKAEEYNAFHEQAELLSINMHHLRTGMESIELENVFAGGGEKVQIDLIKSYSPGKNVERLFAKAKKLKAKIGPLDAEIRNLNDRINELESIQNELKQIETAEIPETLIKRLDKLGLAGEQRQVKGKTAVAIRLPYKQYSTSAGEIIMVGRSARDNDQLTFKVARKNDLWFHSQQSSGSHVVLKRPSKSHEFQKMSIIETAEIAAFYSTAKGSDSVPVIFTEVKYVRKVKKGKPGQVLADRVKSVLVTPKRPKN